MYPIHLDISAQGIEMRSIKYGSGYKVWWSFHGYSFVHGWHHAKWPPQDHLRIWIKIICLQKCIGGFSSQVTKNPILKRDQNYVHIYIITQGKLMPVFFIPPIHLSRAAFRPEERHACRQAGRGSLSTEPSLKSIITSSQPTVAAKLLGTEFNFLFSQLIS